MTKILFYILVGLTYGNSCLFILMLNPIHSLLLLIQIFLFGSWFLFLLNMEFFGIIFLIVYLGAILVLFIFVVMMLDIKVAAVKQDSFGGFLFKSLIIWFSIPFFAWILMNDYSIIGVFDKISIDTYNSWTPFYNHFDFFELINPSTKVAVLGRFLYQHHLFVFLIVGLLLYIAMVGAIVLTLDKKVVEHQKLQNASVQTMRKNVIRYFKSV